MAAPKAKSKKDACYYKVKARYKFGPQRMLQGLWLNAERLEQQIGVIKVAVRKSKRCVSSQMVFQNKGKGWVDCKTGKPCGRSGIKSDSKRGYPACRPTMAQCKTAAAKAAMRKKIHPAV